VSRILEKVEIKIEQVKDDVFSPGDVYWKRKSGIEVLISGKGDVLNIEMIQKLAQSNNTILIENQIDYASQKKLIEAFNKYESEILIPKKLEARSLFVALLLKYYYNTTATQFELNQLFGKLFSTVTRDQAENYLSRDREYFVRAINIATSYTLCAFLLGYYSEDFLKQIYNSTILSQMEIGKNELITTLKEKIEFIGQKTSLNDANKAFVRSIVEPGNFNQGIFFEKANGTGLMNITIYEMSDLELILTSLSYYYHFSDQDRLNILAEINEGKFAINRTVLNLLKRNFELVTNKVIEAA